MKSITILKRGLLQLALVWLCSLSASAQVPSTMDYQIMAKSQDRSGVSQQGIDSEGRIASELRGW